MDLINNRNGGTVNTTSMNTVGISSFQPTTTHTLPRRCVRLREERPHSLYDNIGDELGRSNTSTGVGGGYMISDDPNGQQQQQQQHSLTAGMVTTVPQNLVAPKIEGRHVPTRSSLRHSRMIVLNKQGKVPRKYLPHVVRRHKLATSVLILQILIGIAITTLAAWLLLWAPNLPLTDIPYWSGLPVLFSAFIGLMLLCWCRREYPGMPVRYHVAAFRIFSILASLLAGVSSFCAGGFALAHLIRLYNGISSCQPAHSLDSTCVCRTHQHYNISYTDLSCPEVWNILSVLLIASTAANIIAGILTSMYIYLHWSTGRAGPYVYTRVNQPLFITNKL